MLLQMLLLNPCHELSAGTVSGSELSSVLMPISRSFTIACPASVSFFFFDFQVMCSSAENLDVKHMHYTECIRTSLKAVAHNLQEVLEK